VESGERVVVGVNRYMLEKETPIPILRIDPAIERAQVDRVRQLRAARDNARADKALDEVERTASSNDNLLPAILAAVESYATLGEISDRMRRAFGEYRETVIW
jgi:methylmalonyl-CoA mutase N-terminal domain/subunit